MVKKLLHPQEIETFYVLPALRKHLASEMKQLGIKQKDIAEIMSVNTAAISQYSSTKRGSKFEFGERMLDEIKKSAIKVKDRHSYLEESQKLLRMIRMTKTLCEIHKKFSDVPLGCNPKVIGCDRM